MCPVHYFVRRRFVFFLGAAGTFLVTLRATAGLALPEMVRSLVFFFAGFFTATDFTAAAFAAGIFVAEVFPAVAFPVAAFPTAPLAAEAFDAALFAAGVGTGAGLAFFFFFWGFLNRSTSRLAAVNGSDSSSVVGGSSKCSRNSGSTATHFSR